MSKTGLWKSGVSIKKSVPVILLTLSMLLIIFCSQTFARNQTLDVKGHWAEEQIFQWIDRGLVTGYGDGSFRPNVSITRAEFMTIVNKAMGFKEQVEISFSDVSHENWYYQEVAKAVKAGYITGNPDGTMNPNREIFRQEAAVIIFKLLQLDEVKDNRPVDSFSDSKEIASWSAEKINAVVNAGYMSGYPDGSFGPTKPITRAETITILAKAAGELYNRQGVYGPEAGKDTITSNVTVTADDVTLKNLKISGDLFLTAGIGEGAVYLNNITVEGRTIVAGGGENSIIFENSNLGLVIMKKDDGRVRITFKGNSSATAVTIRSGGKLDIIGEDCSITTVLIESDNEIELSGNFDTVNIEQANARVIFTNGLISNLNIGPQASGTTVNGNGKIIRAFVSADAVIESQPIQSFVQVGITANIGGQDVQGDKTAEQMQEARDSEYEPSEDATPQPATGGGGGSSRPAPAVLVTGITVSSGGVTELVGSGQTLQMSAGVEPSNASNKTVTWSVEAGDTSASISSGGLLTATGIGEITVKAKAQDNSGIVGEKVVTLTATPEEYFEHIINLDAGGNYIVITDYNVAGGSDVLIPSKIGNYPVRIIGSQAFYEKGLTSVIIPDSVTTIGDRAFYDNNLTNVVIGNSVSSIGEDAFSTNSLTSVDIPDGVQVISEGAFAFNNLSSVTIPPSVVSIGIRAFMGLTEDQINGVDKYFVYGGPTVLLGHIGIPNKDLIIPDGVETIGAKAFENCSLNSLTISEDVLVIEDGAFADNNLSSLTIPDNVVTIGDKGAAGEYSRGAFSNNNLTEIVIGNSVKIIGSRTFINNSLSDIIIPNGVETIGRFAFQNNSLESVTIPDNVNIEQSALRDNHITSITIGEDVTIGMSLLEFNNDKFKDVYETGGAGTYTGTQTGEWTKVAFGGFFTFNADTGTITGYDENAGSLDVVIPPSIEGVAVVTIGNNAFDSKGLTSVIIPHGVQTIGDDAFFENELTSLVIPDTVLTIGEFAFEDNRIASLVIGSSVTTIGQFAFSDNEISSVIIPNSVEEIDLRAFANNSITSITIGAGVDIGNDMLAIDNNNFREAYIESGAGTYYGTQTGVWAKSVDFIIEVFPAEAGTAADITNSGPYVPGTEVNIQASANPRYDFDGWTADSGTFDNCFEVNTTFSMPAEPVTITAHFVVNGNAVEVRLTGSETIGINHSLTHTAAVLDATGHPVEGVYVNFLLSSEDDQDLDNVSGDKDGNSITNASGEAFFSWMLSGGENGHKYTVTASINDAHSSVDINDSTSIEVTVEATQAATQRQYVKETYVIPPGEYADNQAKADAAVLLVEADVDTDKVDVAVFWRDNEGGWYEVILTGKTDGSVEDDIEIEIVI